MSAVLPVTTLGQPDLFHRNYVPFASSNWCRADLSISHLVGNKFPSFRTRDVPRFLGWAGPRVILNRRLVAPKVSY